MQVGEMYNKAHQFQGQKIEGQGHYADYCWQWRLNHARCVMEILGGGDTILQKKHKQQTKN